MKDLDKAQFRDYENSDQRIRDFYVLNHRNQTLEFARDKRDQYRQSAAPKMGIWAACEYLNTLVDDSDPDTELSQIEHLLQTAEAIRADGHPRWFILTGLVHDLGKILCLFGEPQWCVTGDSFPLGCAFSEAIVYAEYFEQNPDKADSRYSSKNGVYECGIGLEHVTMSWGHDEYMYLVARDYLPEEALYMIRYHSFYSGHSSDAYDFLMNDKDREMFEWVKKFNPYDLYSKVHARPDVETLKPYYLELISEFFPAEVAW